MSRLCLIKWLFWVCNLVNDGMLQYTNRLFIISLYWIYFKTDWEWFMCQKHRWLEICYIFIWKCLNILYILSETGTVFILFAPTAKFRPHWWGGRPDRCDCARRGPPRPHQQLPLQCWKWAGHPLQWHSCAREPPRSTGLPDNYKGW